MAFTVIKPAVDVEVQQITLRPPELGETRDMRNSPSERTRFASRALVASSSQQADLEAQSIASPPSPSGDVEDHETDNHQSERVSAAGQTPSLVTQDEIHTSAQAQAIPEVDPNSGFERSPEEKPMIGDFDGSANALWSLYGQEAKSHDESCIQTLKDDMDGVLIFAGLYSAVLTSFIIDSKQNLKPNPSDQMVYYLQQNVAIMSQISRQMSFIVPQFAIPTTPPPPFPTFNPSATNVRVNAFWFMALTFSLSAALLATLVQQWVRDYMHVFQRYGDPLKSARIRQYLYEGLDGWYMPIVAEAVPGLLHLSLFLFFVGLGDFILNINTTVGITTTVPIGITGILYILTTFAPVLYPQSPYQNSFSGLIWYIVQKSKLFGRSFKDRDGKSRLVNTDMVQGQLQLAMEETEDRKGRDAQAIRWLVDSLTEDGEMESFAMAIPGSFNGGWSFEVWTKVSKLTEDEMNITQNRLVTGLVTDIPPLVGPPVVTQPQRSPRFRTIHNPFSSIVRLIRIPTASHSRTNTMELLPAQHPPNIHPSSFPPTTRVVHDLSKRIAHLFETCKNRSAFASVELWQRRTRACVETAVLLVCCVDAELGWFGDILRTLGDVGDFEKMRESSLVGQPEDQLFVIRWTCLSIVAIRRMLNDNESLKDDARSAVASYRAFRDGEVAEKNARGMYEVLKNAWWLTLRSFFDYRRDSTTLRRIPNETPLVVVANGKFRIEGDLQSVDSKVSILQERIHQDSYMILRQFPFTQFSLDLNSEINYDRFFDSLTDPLTLLFVFPWQLLRTFEDSHRRHFLPSFMWEHIGDVEWVLSWQERIGHLLQRQLWRLQDLRDGGGLGFTVELFLLALNQLLSRFPSQDSHSTLYISTFRVITSDWREYKRSLGTQKLLLDVVASEQGFIHQYSYPTYITDELLALLEHFLEGLTGPHIDHAMQQLSHPLSGADNRPGIQEFRAKALRIISLSR